MHLKVLSIEMDLDESGVIPKVFIKERGAEILRKFARPPSCKWPFQFAINSLFTNSQL